MVRLLIVLTVFSALQLQPGAWAAPQTWIAPQDVRDRVGEFSHAYQQLADEIPGTLHDVDAVAEQLDYDVEAAVGYVRDEIAYDAYEGVLRGPAGTISAAAGSSWDQAVLLAGLINAMAGEAMIVRGTLDEAAARRLLALTLAPRPDLAEPISKEDALATLGEVVSGEARERLADALSAEGGATSEEYVEEITRRLLAALEREGISLGDEGGLDALVSAIASDYVWVQYRDTPNDDWQMAHPAFGAGGAPQIEPEEYLADTVPDDRLHRVRLELEIERREGDEVRTTEIMDPYSRPAANLAARQVVLEIAPNTADRDGGAGFFIPLLNGAPAKDAKAFTLRGLTASAEDAAAGPELFATIGDRFGGALDRIGEAMDGEAAGPRLTGVILKVTHIAPGGEEHRQVRRLADFRDGPPENASQALTFRGDLDVSVGRENLARALQSTLSSQAEQVRKIPYLVALTTGDLEPEAMAGHPAFREMTQPIMWPAMAVADDAFAGPALDNAAVVRTGPLVVMRRISAGSDEQTGRLIQMVDILHNPVRGLVRENEQVLADPAVALRQGVRETAVEQVLAGGQAEDSWLAGDISSFINSDKALKAWLEERDAEPELSERVQADFEDSGLLLMADGEEAVHWWRIDPETGQTLGMGVRGGESATEYAILVNALTATIGTAFFYNSVQSCDETYGVGTKMADCCIVGNLMMTYAGAGVGGTASAATSWGAQSTWASALGDFAFEVVYDVAGAIGGDAITDPACKAAQ